MGIYSTSFVATWTVLILHWFTFLKVGHVKGCVHNKALKKEFNLGFSVTKSKHSQSGPKKRKYF